MSRYIVTPILGLHNIPYYVVTDTSTGKGVEGYGCDTWAQHRADALNASQRTNNERGPDGHKTD
jgi:hypothetical protein